MMSHQYPQVILYIATSQDGFIADEHGGVDWLPKLEPPTTTTTDYGYTDFYASIDTVVMGSKTYEQMLSFGGEWPYAGKQTYVFTSSNTNDNNKNNQIFFTSPDISTFMSRMRDEKKSKIWLVGGAKLINSFQQQSLIDQCIVTVIPQRIHRGIPLTLDLEHDFTLVEKKEYPGGVIQNIYEVI